MFKQIKFRLVSKQGEGFKISDIVELVLSDVGATEAFIKDGQDLLGFVLDQQMNFLQEFTTKYDAKGAGIYTGDIIRRTDTEGEYFAVAFVDGQFMAINEIREIALPLNEAFARTCEKAGTVYQNSDLVEATPTQEQIEEKVNNQNA